MIKQTQKNSQHVLGIESYFLNDVIMYHSGILEIYVINHVNINVDVDISDNIFY